MRALIQHSIASTLHGKRYLFRTAAAFVSARLAIDPIPPLSAKQLDMKATTGGLIIAGSYVPKTTAQLAKLTEGSKKDLTTVVLDVNKLLFSPESAENSVASALKKAEEELKRGQDVLIMTSRDLVVGADEKKSLDIGATVARSLVVFLQRLQTRPRYVIAKVSSTSPFPSIASLTGCTGWYYILRHGYQRPQHEASHYRWASFFGSSAVAL